ncbi:hypothetical protein [Leekyejoonella antrihumi]|uniref:Uncharacterized protein n=1 Tax=Leekyejoonella antrihumi TaxID=1660198 RepID=A0A563DT45_9MICO|nr:hypothetical protein [Leekyejoonella antrihumi]TWP33420.1 hypothetical protein FGL98_21310 [Leekyejoonella antrihumi]
MNMINGVFIGTMVITAIALVALVATVGTWTVQFFARNRVQRVRHHEPLVGYYRGLASHSFAH